MSSLGLASAGTLGAAGASGSAPATGPDTWDPWHYWDAADAVDAADFAWPSNNGASFSQTTDASEPTVGSSADWNGKQVVTLGTSDLIELDTGDVSLVDQRFFHDGSTSWYAAILVEPTSASNKSFLYTRLSSGSGFYLETQPSNGVLFRVYNGSSAVGLLTTSGPTLSPSVPHIIEIQMDISANVIRAAIDGGDWISSGAMGTLATGDPANPLRLGAGAADQGRVAYVFVSKTIPDAARRKEILDYFLGLDGTDTTADGWVEQYPVSANGAMYSPEDGTLSGFMTDLSGNGNDLTTAGNDPSIDAATYGAPVVVFDGVNDELDLPSSFDVTSAEDLPFSCGFSIRRSSETSTSVLFAGVNPTDYGARIEISTTNLNAYRNGGGFVNIASPANSADPDTWESLSFDCQGNTASWHVDSNPEAATSGSWDSGAPTDPATVSKLGSRGSGEMDASLARFWIDPVSKQGMARAKLQRWVDYYAQSL